MELRETGRVDAQIEVHQIPRHKCLCHNKLCRPRLRTRSIAAACPSAGGAFHASTKLRLTHSPFRTSLEERFRQQGSTPGKAYDVMRMLRLTRAAATIALAACDTHPHDARMPAGSGAGMMSGMPTPMHDVTLIARMELQLDSFALVAPAQMSASMTAHRALATQMMEAMGFALQRTAMVGRPDWMALRDSVTQDLGTMPGLTGHVLQERMQAYIGRMRRMMAMYQGMDAR